MGSLSFFWKISVTVQPEPHAIILEAGLLTLQDYVPVDTAFLSR